MMPGPKEEAIYLTTRFAVDMSHSFPLATSAGGGGVRRVRINLDCKIDTNRVGSIYSRPGFLFVSVHLLDSVHFGEASSGPRRAVFR